MEYEELIKTLENLPEDAQKWIKRQVKEILYDRGTCLDLGICYASPKHEDIVKAMNAAYKSYLSLGTWSLPNPDQR